MEATPPQRSLEEARVLLVHGEPERAAEIEGLLWEECGVTLVVARDGARGTQLAHDFDWEMVLVDMGLPGLDGLRVLEAAKTRDPGTGVVALESAAENPRADSLRDGADAVVPAPLDRVELAETVRTLRWAGPAPDGPVPAPDEGAAEPGTRVLAVGFRPGDVEAGCGGTLLRHRGAGHQVYVLTFSPAGSEERSEAARRAAYHLGVRLFVARTQGEAGPEAAGDFVRGAVRDLRPSMAYVPTPHHRHSLHRNGARAILEAAREVPGVFCFETEASTADFHPSLFVDVADHLQSKARAVAEYAPGADAGPHEVEGLVRQAARYWSRFAGQRLAEPLEAVRVASRPPGALEESPLFSTAPESG